MRRIKRIILWTVLLLPIYTVFALVYVLTMMLLVIMYGVEGWIKYVRKTFDISAGSAPKAICSTWHTWS